MKQWYCLTCPTCGFRFPLRKFKATMKPIHYPLQIVTGGGRAKGFKVVEYLPWTTLPKLQYTDAGKSLLHLYRRLGTAYDNFYEVLGFLSPKIKMLLRQIQKSYTHSYRVSPCPEYVSAYAANKSSQTIGDAYFEDDYSKVYTQQLIHQFKVGAENE